MHEEACVRLCVCVCLCVRVRVCFSTAGIFVALRGNTAGMCQGLSEQVKGLTWGGGEIRENSILRKGNCIEGERKEKGSNVYLGRLRATNSDAGVTHQTRRGW